MGSAISPRQHGVGLFLSRVDTVTSYLWVDIRRCIDHLRRRVHLVASIGSEIERTMGRVSPMKIRKFSRRREGRYLARHGRGLQYNPFRLPAISKLPRLSGSSDDQELDDEEATRLVKIAGVDEVLIGLTNKGHVLKFGGLDDKTATFRISARQTGFGFFQH